MPNNKKSRLRRRAHPQTARASPTNPEPETVLDPSSSDESLSTVTWYRQGSLFPSPPDLDLMYWDTATRIKLKETCPEVTYSPVTWDYCLRMINDSAAGASSSTALENYPFELTCVVWFTRIARTSRARKPDAQAGVVMLDSKKIVGLTPGYTQTPCAMFLPAKRLPPDALNRPLTMDDPHVSIALARDEGIEVDYLLSYWERDHA